MNIIYLIFFITIIYYNIIKNIHILHIFQQNLYNTNNRYLNWLKKNILSFLDLELLSLIIVIFSYKSKLLLIISIIIYLLNSIILLLKKKKTIIKKPLVITKRIIRLNITYYLIYLILLIISILTNNYYFLTLSISILTFISFILILIVNFINKPVEYFVYKYYEKKAQKKLKSLTNLQVIGITGSYGKTSCKNILNTILNEKYITKPTPKNLNTEYGMMITINNYLDKFDELFIAEMGAYKPGEIKTLCDMVHPKYGIITRIGLAHLTSFKTEEAIIKTKFELIESLPKDGLCILNKDDPKQVNYKLKNKCQVIWIGILNKDADYIATNIKNSYEGSSFDVKIDGKLYPFSTKLLGNHNIYNILASIALGLHLGMSIPELQRGIKKVKPVESRLELRDYGYMYQINDAYNSNPVGANIAIDVLTTMPGYKVIVTPGMTELGPKENELNKEFGSYMAQKLDLIILVGKKKTMPIYEGLKEKGEKEEKIMIVNNVYEAYDILKKLQVKEKIYALFENDLPDIYNE